MQNLSHHFLLHFSIGMGSYDQHFDYLAYRKHFFHKGSPFGVRKYKWIQRGDPYEKSVLLELRKHTLIFCVVVIGTDTNWKMQ